MKGTPERQAAIEHTFNVEDMIEAEHPLRAIKRMVDRALADMSSTFRAAHAHAGRPGVAAETLLKTLLPQCLDTIRSYLSWSDAGSRRTWGSRTGKLIRRASVPMREGAQHPP